MPDIGDLTYFQVVRTVSPVPGGVLSAEVTFEAQVTKGLAIQADVSADIIEILARPVHARIVGGVLMKDGTPGVELLSAAEVAVDGGFSYLVTFTNARVDGGPIKDGLKSLTFEAPTDGTQFDLKDAAAIVASTATPTVRGPRGFGVDEVASADGDTAAEFFVQGESIGVLPLPSAAWASMLGKPRLAPTGAWVPGAAYVVGQAITSPHGDVIVRKSAGTSRASFDSTEQALWASNPYQSDYWCDIGNGVFRSSGDVIAPATLLTHNTPGTPGFVEVCPAFTNLIGPFNGGGVGVVTSGGGSQFLPRNNTGPGGERWTSVNTAVDKSVRYLNSHELEFSMTVPKGGTSNAAGIMTPQLSGVNAGASEAQFYLDMSGVNTEKLFFYLAWESAPAARYFFMPSVWQANSQGHGRIVMTVPVSSLANDRLMFMVSNPYHSDIEARILLKSISVAPSVSNLLRDTNPVVIGSQDARTATLNVPNGDYDLFAWTDRGITSAVAVSSGGIDLLAAFGSCRIYKLAAWQAGRYATGMVDDTPAYTTVYETDSAAMLQLRTVTAPDANIASNHPNQAWSLQSSATYRRRDRIEVRPGDRMQVDPVLYKRRNEVTCLTPMPFDTDIWMSYPIKIDGGIHATTPGSTHETADVACIWQWRYTDMSDDTVGLSPEFNLSIQGDNTITVNTMSTTVQNPPDGSPPYVLRWAGEYVPGRWHRFVARIRFNPDGGGKLGIWWDGQAVYPWQDTPIGHHKTFGPQAHWGYYGVQSDDVISIERDNVEFGTADLSSRILRPLPI